MKVKRVITYGTFDLIHYGHINLLERAKKLGDYLIVGLSTNEFNEKKNKKCYFSYEKRKQLLEAIRYVDLVIPEESWGQKITDIKEYQIDTFVMGNDWTGKFDFIEDSTAAKVIYLSRTPEISTTKIKKDLGWTPKFNFDQGIRETVLWYLKNAEWVKNVKNGNYQDWIKKNYEER